MEGNQGIFNVHLTQSLVYRVQACYIWIDGTGQGIRYNKKCIYIIANRSTLTAVTSQEQDQDPGQEAGEREGPAHLEL